MKRAFLAALPCSAALALLICGCPASTSNTTLFTPLTGIQIDATSLLFGFGCGTGPGQVFKYAAVVSFSPQAPDGGSDAATDAGSPVPTGISGVFDCFTNGVFSNLPESEAGSLDFTVQVFAYNEASFPAQLAAASTTGGSMGVAFVGDVAANVIPFEGMANWTAVCTATQVTGVTVNAICGPLTPQATAAGSADAGGEAGPADAGVDGDAGDTSTMVESD